MTPLIAQASEEPSNSIAYQMGYEVGYFVGSHFYESLTAFVLVAAVVLYFAVFRKRNFDW